MLLTDTMQSNTLTAKCIMTVLLVYGIARIVTAAYYWCEFFLVKKRAGC